MDGLVAEKLAAHEGEYLLFGQYFPRGLRELSFAAYREAVLAEMTRRLGAKRRALATPPDPNLITIKSWQFGFTDAQGEDEATRAFRDGVCLQLLNYRDDYLSSQRWQGYLRAFERPEQWVVLGRAEEAAGWLLEANACFAAARWLDPAVEPTIAGIVAGRDPQLPRRLLEQPLADFPGRQYMDRHWQAWGMKNSGRLDIPTLLRWECDRNFSVRARIYRSLGQRPHPAVIQALQEGTRDPHPFARAQAVRSLGWCADPTCVEWLQTLAANDPHAEVRRTAIKAGQRIAGFWRFYGEWRTIMQSRARALAAAQELADVGLRCFAWEVLVNYGDAGSGAYAEIDALTEMLEAELPGGGFGEKERQYNYWFKEGSASETAGEPAMTFAEASALAGEEGERGFEGRRIVRRLGLGTGAQRRVVETR